MKKSPVLYFAFLILSSFFKDTTSRKFKRNVKTVKGETNSRIIGGEFLVITEVPYQAFVKVDRGNDDKFFCGGSIITDTNILTGAHCLINAQSVEVYVGSDDLDTATVYQSTNFMSHPSFDANNRDYDVALIFIDGGIPLDGENTTAVTLVDENTSLEVGSDIELSGFGLSEGDNGGPAVMTGTQTQVGIIAYGNPCDGFTDPIVLINVADPEIQSFIRSNSNL